jgi:predicted dehydrogenase
MTVRVGVVGCGYWGSKHSRVLHGLAEVEQVVHIDPREDRLRALAGTFPGSRGFTSLQAAVPWVDALVVATPPTTHVPVAMCGLEAGKHVLVEKPLATTSSGARRLVAAAAAADRVLMVGHTFEYDSAVAKLRQLVQTGEFGEILHVDSARLNLGLYQSDVNVVMDLAPHDISIMNALLGRTPVAVEARGSRHAARDHEDVAYLRLYYEDRLSVNIHVSWLDPCKVRRMTIVGSRKMAIYNDLAAGERLRVYDMGVHPADTDDPARSVSYRFGDITVPFLEQGEPLSVQDRHFARSILDGTRPRTDGRNGLAVVEVLEALELALQDERRVELAEVRRVNGHSVPIQGDVASTLVGHGVRAER